MTILELVQQLDAAHHAMHDAQIRFFEIREAVIQASIEAGITERRVYVVSNTGWYVDPPGVNQYQSGWCVTYGSVPITVGEPGG